MWVVHPMSVVLQMSTFQRRHSYSWLIRRSGSGKWEILFCFLPLLHICGLAVKQSLAAALYCHIWRTDHTLCVQPWAETKGNGGNVPRDTSPALNLKTAKHLLVLSKQDS